MRRPLGIAASFAKVAFKKDGVEVYSTQVSVGGCFGPDPRATDSNIANWAFKNLEADIKAGKVSPTVMSFNSVALPRAEYKAGISQNGFEGNQSKNIVVLGQKI